MCRSCRFLSKHESFPSRSRFEEARGRGLDRRWRILSSMCFEYCDYESCNLSNYRSKFRDQRMLREDSSFVLSSTSTSSREDSSCKNRDKKRPFHSKSSLHSLAHSLTLSDTIWWFSSIGQRIRVCFRDIDACLKPRIRFLEDGFVSDRFQTLCSLKTDRRTSSTIHLDLLRFPCFASDHPFLNVSASQRFYECPSAIDFDADKKHGSGDVHDVDLVRVRLRPDLEKEFRLPPLDKASVFFFLFFLFGFFALAEIQTNILLDFEWRFHVLWQ